MLSARDATTDRRWMKASLVLVIACASALGSAEASATPLSRESGARLADPTTRVPGADGQLSKYHIDDEEPTKDLPPLDVMRKDPLEFGYLLMDLSVIADKSFDKKDFARAARYYRALTLVVPEKSVAFGQLCASYAELGKLQPALDACRAALGLEGTQVRDFERFLALLLQSKRKLLPAEVAEADQVFAHVKAQKVEDPAFYQLACDLALNQEDIARMQACTQSLAKIAPKDPKTITYQWSLALMQKDDKAAFVYIQQAKAAGMKPDGVRKMQSATLALGRKQNRSRMVTALALLGVAIFGALFLGRQALRYLRQVQVDA